MGFINNYKDNFLPSNHPWGDDNISVYKYPKNGKSKNKTNKFDVNPTDLGYEQLCAMIAQLSSVVDTLPECEDKVRIRHKLQVLHEEKANRDSLEAATSKDRDDSFDTKNLIVKEDVVEKVDKVVPESVKPNRNIEKIKLELSDIDLSVIEEEDEEEILEQPLQPQTAGLGGDVSNFLIASLIIICVISLTNK